MKVDLHLHSVYSDGKYTPDLLCEKAVAAGVCAVSITDHDTLLGAEDKAEAAKRHGLAYVSGWEISAYLGDHKVHMLGYGCQCNEAYEQFLQDRKDGAIARMRDRIEKLRKIGITITEEEIYAQRAHADTPIHTMHLARVLAMRMGITDREVYERYLGWGLPVYSNLGRPTPQEAVDCIHACGGVAVIAHPGRISLEYAEREGLIRDLAKGGVDGIEAHYTTHTEEETAYFLRLAQELRLLVTGGSDTHVEDGIHIIGKPAFSPSEALLEKLRL